MQQSLSQSWWSAHGCRKHALVLECISHGLPEFHLRNITQIPQQILRNAKKGVGEEKKWARLRKARNAVPVWQTLQQNWWWDCPSRHLFSLTVNSRSCYVSLKDRAKGTFITIGTFIWCSICEVPCQPTIPRFAAPICLQFHMGAVKYTGRAAELGRIQSLGETAQPAISNNISGNLVLSTPFLCLFWHREHCKIIRSFS